MATRRPDKRERALKLVEQLLKLTPDHHLAKRAYQLRDRLKLPMSVVLAKVPGETIVQKAAACGVSRQAYYNWLSGRSRPNDAQSATLAKLTGYDVAMIAGRRSLPAAPARAARAAGSV